MSNFLRVFHNSLHCSLPPWFPSKITVDRVARKINLQSLFIYSGLSENTTCFTRRLVILMLKFPSAAQGLKLHGGKFGCVLSLTEGQHVHCCCEVKAASS